MVRTITTFFKKGHEMFGDLNIVFLCWKNVCIGLDDLWPFHEHSLNQESRVYFVTFKYLLKHFPSAREWGVRKGVSSFLVINKALK